MFSDHIKLTLQVSSKIAVNYFGKVKGTVKGNDNNQVLTKADLEIGRFIIEKIRKDYPSHNIIDEEAGVINNNSEYTWVIDPIDGTSNFSCGIPTYGIIIGLLKNNIPYCGGVALPFFNEIATAQKGKGSFCNNKKLRITREKRLLNTLIAYAVDGHQENPIFTHEECSLLGNIVLSIRNLRAAGSVFDGIQVAKGKYGGYLNKTSKIWDNVGQQIIIEEASGIYTDFFGKSIDYSNPLEKSETNFTWCTGAPEIHKQLQKIINNVDLPKDVV